MRMAWEIFQITFTLQGSVQAFYYFNVKNQEIQIDALQCKHNVPLLNTIFYICFQTLTNAKPRKASAILRLVASTQMDATCAYANLVSLEAEKTAKVKHCLQENANDSFGCSASQAAECTQIKINRSNINEGLFSRAPPNITTVCTFYRSVLCGLVV